MRQSSSSLWRGKVFLRNRHPAFDALLARYGLGSGIYLIGCGGEILYIGQTWHLSDRPIDSLGRVYHQIPNVHLPWSIAFAPCIPEEMIERESGAIRRYAPCFNTSIPSVEKSQGRMPQIAGIAPVFQDQDGPCGAFDAANLQTQAERAEADLNPPWKPKKRRPSTRPPRRRQVGHSPVPPTPRMSQEELLEFYGVPFNEPLIYPVNLCTDGSVVTKDGEYLGTWSMDEYEYPSFTPDGTSEPLLSHVVVGLLCLSIREWHAKSTFKKQ